MQVQGEQPVPVLLEQGTKIERWDETESAAPQFAAGRSSEGRGRRGMKEGDLAVAGLDDR